MRHRRREKKAFLEMLSANAQCTFTFIGTLKPWNANVQVNVDIAEMQLGAP